MLNDKQFEKLSAEFEHVKLVKLMGAGENIHVFGSIHGQSFEAVKEVNRLWDQQDKRPEGYFILDRESLSFNSKTSIMACVYAHESIIKDIGDAERIHLLKVVWS